MCMGGGSVAPPPAKTLAEMQAETNNAYVNPISGEADPNWKLAAKTDSNKKQPGASPGGHGSSARSELYG